MIIIYHCDDPGSLSKWQVVNDGVMGGLSKGAVSADPDGKCQFSGNISLENNGGFSMIRYRTDLGRLADHFRQFEMIIKGDGRQYQFRIKSVLDQRHSYGFYFNSKHDWQNVVIPFEKLIPIFRGNQLDLPTYQGKSLQEVAFLAGKTPGRFNLKIQEIKVL